MNPSQLVSVVAICYNHSEFLEETLNSILNQTYANIEIIILDDCSKDNSVQKIEEWINKNSVKCTLIAHRENQGLCKTLNEGLSLVNGIYYQTIACDDLLMPDKIEKNIKVFQENNDKLAIVHSDAQAIDKCGKTLFESYHAEYGFPNPKPSDYFTALLDGPLIIAPSVIFKTKIIRENGGYDEKYFYEDWPMWLKLSRKYHFYYDDAPLVKYRILDNSLSRSAEKVIKLHKSSVQLLDEQLKLAPEYKNIIQKSISKQIDYLIWMDAAGIKLLFKKMLIDKTAHSIFLFLVSLFGVKSSKAFGLKYKLTGRKIPEEFLNK